jgi:hypothetical protein
VEVMATAGGTAAASAAGMSRDRDAKKKTERDDAAERRPEEGDIATAGKVSDEEFEEYSRKKEKPAHIINANRAEREGRAGVELVINRGTIDKVAVNDTGVVVGLDAKFEIEKVYKKSCIAWVAAEGATFEQIRDHKDVVLNPRS